MLQILIDGHPADLLPDTSLDLEIQNEYLLPGEITTSRAAYLPTLPVTPVNSRLLHHFEILQASGGQQRHRVDAYYSGQLLSSGSFVLTEAGPDGYSGGIVENISEIFGIYSNTPLPDLPFPLFTIPAGHTPVVAGAAAFPCIVNPQYYGNTPPADFTGTMNNYSGGVYSGVSPCVPFFRVKYILQQISQLTGVNFVITTPVLDDLVFCSLREEAPLAAFQPGAHLPAWTIGRLLIELKKVLNLQITPDLQTRTVHVGSMQGVFFQLPPVDWSSKMTTSPGKMPETTPSLAVSLKVDSADTYLKENPGILATQYSLPGQPYTLVECQFGSVPVDTASGLGIIRQEGQTPVNNQLDKKFEPRLAYFQAAGSVPTAHLQGPLELSPAGILSLYCEYASIRENAVYVKIPLQLTAQDLTHPLTRRIHINGLNFLLVSASASLPLNGLVECVFVKV